MRLVRDKAEMWALESWHLCSYSRAFCAIPPFQRSYYENKEQLVAQNQNHFIILWDTFFESLACYTMWEYHNVQGLREHPLTSLSILNEKMMSGMQKSIQCHRDALSPSQTSLNSIVPFPWGKILQNEYGWQTKIKSVRWATVDYACLWTGMDLWSKSFFSLVLSRFNRKKKLLCYLWLPFVLKFSTYSLIVAGQ